MAACAYCHKHLNTAADEREIPPVAFCSAKCKADYRRSMQLEKKTTLLFYAGIAIAFLCCLAGIFVAHQWLPAVGCAVCAVTLLAFPYLTGFLSKWTGLKWSKLAGRLLGLALLALAAAALFW